jgi:tetratricopeptide (TPR) repeat protein
MVSKRIQDDNDLSCWEFPRIKGFCMLIPSKVVAEVGLFDEQFGFGNFEDDDYSCRVRYSGYELLVADDSVLFHFGSVSFKDSGIDWNKQMVENMDKFNRKWAQGRRVVLEHQVIVPELPSASPDAKELYRTGLELSSQGRFKDAFAMYSRSLELDSTQETVASEIVKLLVTEFDVDSSRDVLLFLQRKYPGLRAFGAGKSESLAPTLEWHSQVESLLGEAKFPEALALLMNILQRQGEGFEVCNLLGIAKYQIGIVDEACRWFEKALKFNPVDSDAILNYYDAALRMGISQNVVRIMEHALSLNPAMMEIRLALQEFKVNQKKGSLDAEQIIQSRERNIAAENLIREGLPEKAREILEAIVQQDPDNYRSLNNLGLLAWYERQADVAYEYFSRASDLNPWYVDAVVNQYDCAFLANRIDEFKPRLQRAIELNPGIDELLHIQQEIGNAQTPERLQVYFRNDAEQTKLRDQILAAHRLLEEEKFDSAILLFADLLNDYPENVECLNGMGIAAFYRRRYDDAQLLFRHALQISPLDSDTLVNFWDAAVKLGDTLEARAVLQNALSIDPSLTAVAAILEGN